MTRRCVGVSATVLVAVAGLVLALSQIRAPSASATTPPTALNYQIANLPAGAAFEVDYTGGITSNTNGRAQASHGAFDAVAFVNNVGLRVSAAPRAGALYASVGEQVGVSGPQITGTALVPAGATVTLYNSFTGQTIDLPNGPFTMNTTPQLGAERLNSTDETVQCKGDAAACTAVVDVAGEAARRRVSVELSHPGLGLEAVRPEPASEKSGFQLSDGHLSTGRDRYVVDVATLRAEPAGARLRLTFGAREKP
jgi:hypothetical protein